MRIEAPERGRVPLPRVRSLSTRPLSPHPRASVVINTFNRVFILEKSIRSLRAQTYDRFEVIVVDGPSRDGTKDILRELGGDIKFVEIDEANLSKSRNAGIAAASGEVVLFLDDDAFAEPGWIANIVAAYADPKVGGVGTRVWDHHGFEEQENPRLIDKFYTAILGVNQPVSAFTYPDSETIPHILGASSSFRMDLLREIGGFDEEIEYFLDESEVCRRVAELGFEIRFLEQGASVHHKFAAGVVRDERKLLTHPFPVVKNKYYVTLGDARRRMETVLPAIKQCDAFAEKLLADAKWQLRARNIGSAEYERFESEVLAGIQAGRQRGFTHAREMRRFAPLDAASFRQFPLLRPNGPVRSLCFISRWLPNRSPGGIARSIYDIAAGIATLGHDISIITATDGASEVEYQNGMWIHHLAPDRLDPRVREAIENIAESGAAKTNLCWSAQAHAEVERIRADRAVDLVVTPLWDTEGLHCVLDRTMNTAVTLQTTFKTYSALEAKSLDSATVEELSLLEKEMMAAARYVHANSQSSKDQIGGYYPPRPGSIWEVARLGIEDSFTPRPSRRQEDGKIRVLYVSRLERRKGTDVFLRAAIALAKRIDDVEFVLVGRDGSNNAHRDLLAGERSSIRSRFVFEGELPDDLLAQAYNDADIFCVPSRFESFGLIYLEAMRAGLPVVACRIGGIPELVLDGETGFLVEPDDTAGLTGSLLKLVEDPELRTQFGRAGRTRFEEHFTIEHMAERTLAVFESFIKAPAPAGAPRAAEPA